MSLLSLLGHVWVPIPTPLSRGLVCKKGAALLIKRGVLERGEPGLIGADRQSGDDQTSKRKEEAEPGEATESPPSQAKAVWNQQEMD